MTGLTARIHAKAPWWGKYVCRVRGHRLGEIELDGLYSHNMRDWTPFTVTRGYTCARCLDGMPQTVTMPEYIFNDDNDETYLMGVHVSIEKVTFDSPTL